MRQAAAQPSPSPLLRFLDCLLDSLLLRTAAMKSRRAAEKTELKADILLADAPPPSHTHASGVTSGVSCGDTHPARPKRRPHVAQRAPYSAAGARPVATGAGATASCNGQAGQRRAGTRGARGKKRAQAPQEKGRAADGPQSEVKRPRGQSVRRARELGASRAASRLCRPPPPT